MKPRDRNLYLSAQVDQKTMGDLTKEIIQINESDERLKKEAELNGFSYEPQPIKIYIDSYGGMVYQCFGLISVMNKSKTPIHTICTGAAMSCGFIILIHGHKKFCYEHSTPLYHQVSAGAWGTVKDMEEKVKEVKRLQKKLEKMTLERTNIPKKVLKKIYKGKKDWYLDAEESLGYGVVDEIL